MGVNGSGKSTLVRMLCALTAPTAGSIEVAGVPVASTGKRGRNVRPKSANRKQLAQLRRHVGYVMQHPEHQLFADTVAEDVAYGPRNQGLGETEVADRVRESLELLHIGHLADRSPFDLSGGQQRLAAIAGVLACNPDVLIMDEPTASLDAQAKKRIHELLRTLKSRGVTVLIITHDREEAEQIADRVVRMPIAAPASGGPVTATVTEPAVSSNGPAHSVIHRLDPRVKMVGFLAAMFTMFAVNTPTQLALGIAITLAVIAAARLNPLRVLESIHPILILLVLMGVVNLFVVRTGTPVVALGPLSITDQGVTIAVLYACRFALVIILGAVFLTTTTPTAMTDAFATLISPLNRLGIHAQEIALVMSLALRFIPTLTDETRAIVDAQSARGGSIETGSLAQRIKAMSAIIVPIFAGTLRHADNLSLALDARCYEEGIRRTHWRALTIAARSTHIRRCRHHLHRGHHRAVGRQTAQTAPVAMLVWLYERCKEIPMALTKKQIKQLRAMANSLKPLFYVGKNDLTESAVNQADETIEKHELIKCAVQDGSGLTAKEAAAELAEQLNAEVVQSIGNRFVLFRRSRRDDVEHIRLVRE